MGLIDAYYVLPNGEVYSLSHGSSVKQVTLEANQMVAAFGDKADAMAWSMQQHGKAEDKGAAHLIVRWQQ